MSRLITLSALIAVGALTVLVQAQADPAAIRLEKVKDNLYVVTGGRQGGGIAGNTTVYVADASRADRRQGMSAGAQAYLAKPCELEELRRTIRRLIAGARGVGAGAD